MLIQSPVHVFTGLVKSFSNLGLQLHDYVLVCCCRTPLADIWLHQASNAWQTSSPSKPLRLQKVYLDFSVSRNAKNLDSIHEHPLIIYRLGNVSTSASKALIWEAKTIYAPPTISRRFWLLKIGCEKKHVKSMKQQVEAWSIQPTVQQPQVSFLSVFQCPLQHDIHAFHSGMLLFRLFYLALLSYLSFI